MEKSSLKYLIKRKVMSMADWFIPVLLRIVLINTIYPVFLKGKVITKDIIQRFFLQYLFCGLISFICAIYLGQFVLSTTLLLLMGVGVLNGFSAYADWQATKINLSAMSLFSFLDDVIAINLGYLILKETQFLNYQIGLGLLLCVAAILFLSIGNYAKRRNENGKNPALPLKFFVYVLIFTSIWGLNAFFTRWFALRDVGIGTFMFGWYFGSFIVATILMLSKKEGTIVQEIIRMKRSSNISVGLISSLFVTVNIGFSYWALALAPLTIVKPIFFVSAMIIPALVGLYYFNEREGLTRTEKLSFPLAIVGGIIIGLGFRG